MNKLIVFIVLLLFLLKTHTYGLIESDVFPKLVYQSALEEGNIEIIKKYLDLNHSANVIDDKGLTPLAYAIKNNNADIIELLIEYKADINGKLLDKLSPLIYAVMLNKKNLIEFLVENGANINYQDSIGRTATMVAVEKNHVECLKNLLKLKPDLELSDYSGKDVYEYASFSRNLTIKSLIAKKNF